jgi:hypothetical protein
MFLANVSAWSNHPPGAYDARRPPKWSRWIWTSPRMLQHQLRHQLGAAHPVMTWQVKLKVLACFLLL